MSKLLEIFCRRDFLFEPKASVLTRPMLQVDHMCIIPKGKILKPVLELSVVKKMENLFYFSSLQSYEICVNVSFRK